MARPEGSFDVFDTVISQYANSPTMVALITAFQDWIDPSNSIEDFVNQIWWLDTAESYGLDVWGRIVAAARVIRVPESPPTFGFDTSDKAWQPFNQAPFYQGAISQNYRLTNEAYRQLILIKAAANIAATTVPALNALLLALFHNRGRCYVSDLGNMTMRYTFEFRLEPWEKTLVLNSGYLPRPAGVLIDHAEVIGPVFGFDGSELQPFNQAPFFTSSTT
jgi:hypothetical protein